MTKARTVTVELEFPFVHEDRPYDRLVLRRMRAGDLLAGEGDANELRSGYRLMACLAEVDLAVIEMLDLDDFEKVSLALDPLLGNSARAAVDAAKKAAERAAETAETASPPAT